MGVAAGIAADSFVRMEGVRKSFGDLLVLDGIDLERRLGRGSRDHRRKRERQVDASPLREPPGADRRRPHLSGRARDHGPRRRRLGDRQRIGIVFQQFNLFPHLRVIDNLTLAARRIRSAAARAEERAHELLERVGLEEKAHSTRISFRAGSSSGSRSRGR